MTVKAQHPLYQSLLPKWQRCRAVASGGDAVKLQTTDFLPALRDQPDDDYQAYLTRAEFFNATCRTIGGFVGMMFRKPPLLEIPVDAKDDLVLDITMDGTGLFILLQDAAWEQLAVGRLGWLVDYPSVENPESVTEADAIRMNLRPKIVKRIAEQIINWHTARVNNRTILSMVVFEEEKIEMVDEFEETSTLVYRVLDLDDAGRYRQRVFSVDEQGKDQLIEGPLYPMKNGKPLEHIPFYFIGVTTSSWDPEEPPLIDLVDTNLSHYRTSADYEHGCHFVGLPTPVITGHTIALDPDTGKPTEKMYIGGSKAWVFPNPDADAKFLEFSGSGLETLRNNLKDKEGRMAVLGARMLEAQKKDSEAAETAAIHRSGENATLAAVAETLGRGATPALKEYFEWAGKSPDAVDCKINKDFFPTPMKPEELTALIGAWQKGGLSKQELFKKLQRGEVIDADLEFEKHEAQIENDTSRLPTPDPNAAPPRGPQPPARKSARSGAT